jgi:hypothetical protein
MRAEFREHPEVVNTRVSGELFWAYEPKLNLLSVGRTEREPIKSLVHEITHWAMSGFLDDEEIADNENRYNKLREGIDELTFFNLSIEERVATYIEDLVNE